MKNILFIYLLLLSGGSFAQPVITAATNNPVPGEIYTVNSCDRSGVMQGSGGAALTWDFHI